MPDLLTFHHLSKEDREELIIFLLAAFANKFSREDTETDVDSSFDDDLYAYHFFVGKEDSKIVCAGALKKTGIDTDVWGISWVAVSPDKQKKGYGLKMVDFLEHHFASRCIKSNQGMLNLGSQKHNFSFYDKLGFSYIPSNNGNRLYYKLVDRSADKKA